MSGKRKMNESGVKRKKGVRMRLIPMIFVIATVISACGGFASTYAGTGAGAPAAAMEEIASESGMAYDTAAYDDGAVLNSGAVRSAETYKYDTMDEAAAAEEAGGGDGSFQEAGGQDAVAAPETSRKLIKTVNISAETEDFDTLVPALQKQVEALGGYIESISVYDVNSYYVENQRVKQRCASLTARVPKEKLDGFLAQFGEQVNVTSRSENVEDVTLRYVDLESHKKALLTEQERLLALMEKAETVEDIIAIEGRLSEVRYQLESMESQLRTYDNQIDYSTLYLNLEEVRSYSAPETATVWQRIERGFMKSLEDIGLGIRDFAIGLVIDIPYFVAGLLSIVVIILILRSLIKWFIRSRYAGRMRERYSRRAELVREVWSRRREEKATEKVQKAGAEQEAGAKEGAVRTATEREADAEQGAKGKQTRKTGGE